MTDKPNAPRHKLEDVLTAVETGTTITGAARVLGVTRMTMHNYRKRWKSVDDAILAKRHELVDLAESGLRLAVIRQDPWAVTFALKTLAKDVYSERIEHTGEEGKSIVFKVVFEDADSNR